MYSGSQQLLEPSPCMFDAEMYSNSPLSKKGSRKFLGLYTDHRRRRVNYGKTGVRYKERRGRGGKKRKRGGGKEKEEGRIR
jgi:hypothetical protein